VSTILKYLTGEYLFEMKTKTILTILVAAVVGFGITLVSGFFEQTLLPANLWSGTTKTWGGFPFGWWGYSQVGHVYYLFPPHWFSILSFGSDIVFWFLISSAFAFGTLKFVRMKQEKRIYSAATKKAPYV
jgi:hypothetical protein